MLRWLLQPSATLPVLSKAHDGLGNLRRAGVAGPSGDTVHAGFRAAAQTLRPQIRQAIGTLGNLSTIHVVGHSWWIRVAPE